MERQSFAQKLKSMLRGPGLGRALGLLFVSGALFGAGVVLSPAIFGTPPDHGGGAEHASHHTSQGDSHLAHEDGHATPKSGFGRFIAQLTRAVENVQHKADELAHAHQENETLRLEIANLRLKVEGLQLDCRMGEARTSTVKAKTRLSQEAWTAFARTKESIRYEIPGHLLAPQLYTLAVTYLKAGEYEKAALILTHLTGLENSSSYQNSKDYLMTGIAWYRLDNVKLADSYFDLALKQKAEGEALRFQAHARLWKALVSKRTGNNTKAQFWLRELVDHHPRSKEANWVNSTEEKHRARGLAGQEDHHQEH
jgi:tetratricopeptide (TPR) repeat protein